VQVSRAFDAGTESAGPASRRDSNHDHFVTWDTRFGARASRDRRHDWINHCLQPSPARSGWAVRWPPQPDRRLLLCRKLSCSWAFRWNPNTSGLGISSVSLIGIALLFAKVTGITGLSTHGRALGEACRPTSAGEPRRQTTCTRSARSTIVKPTERVDRWDIEFYSNPDAVHDW